MKTYTPEQLATIEQAARKICKITHDRPMDSEEEHYDMPTVHLYNTVIEALKSDFAAQLHSKPQPWISPNTPPEKDGFCMVMVEHSFPKNCKVVIAEYEAESNTFRSESNEEVIFDVIGWMHLPDTKGEAKEMYTKQQMIEFAKDYAFAVINPEDTRTAEELLNQFKAKGGTE